MGTQKILNIGIDLGTSRSVIVCENGMRSYMASYVGYPKDAVSQKMLGKNIIFGDDALKNRLALDLYRPFDKGVLLHSDASEQNIDEYQKAKSVAKELLRQLVSMVIKDEPAGVVLRGVIGAPSLATQNNKKDLLDIADNILDDVLIASEPFTVAYGLNLYSNALIIDIGAGTTDLCRMHGTIPTEEDQITTFKAGDHIDKVFLELIQKKYPDANLTRNMVKRFKEENAILSSQSESVYIELPVCQPHRYFYRHIDKEYHLYC
ncbi:MAG: rod shape-determining protein [Desulfamplus sp.]|nr:rod shape-determining protein [Desulfamplus sp.]